jgi:peptidoglycan/LPS O-acetylase OafA/YrhL
MPLILAVAIYPLPLLVNRLTRWLGRVSYSAYLAHPFLLIALLWMHDRYFHGIFHGHLHGTLTGVLLMFLLLILVAAPVSLFLWRFIEQPGIRLGRRLIAALEDRAAIRASTLVPPAKEFVETGSTSDEQF